MTDFARDIRFGLRSLLRRPLFFAIAVATLGLGIGASTAVFSVVEGALLRPLPFEDAERLAIVWGVAGPEQDIRGASPIEIRDWDAAVDALGPLSYYDATTSNLSGEGESAQVATETVSPSYFGIVGVSPALGRVFTAEDDLGGAPPTAVVSYDLWQTRFGADPSVIGRMIRLDDVPVEVIGVMPRGFRGLSFDTQLWLTLGPTRGGDGMLARGGRWLAAVGRIEPGRTAEEAQGQLASAASRLEELHPGTNTGRGATLLSLRDYYVQQTRPLLLLVMAGVALLLLIACANVANLQIVRGLERGREIALRYALGAGRRRIGRLFVAESAILGVVGALAGLVVAGLGIVALLPLVPQGVLPPYTTPGLDLPVLAFALAAGLGTAAIFGLLPAIRASRQQPASALRGAGRGITSATRGRKRAGGQQAIVVAEVALALILTVGAGLAVRSLAEQLAIRPGFEPEGVLAARLSLPGGAYDAPGRIQFVQRLRERAGGIPGVEAVEVVSNAPLRGYNAASTLRPADDPDREVRYYRHAVTPGFFDALGIPVRGRTFRTTDGFDDPAVAVVSEAFGERLWPGQDPLGRRFLFTSRDTVTVVGVAANVRYRNLTTSLTDPGEDPDVYFAYEQLPAGSFDILLKTAGAPAALTGSLRAVAAELDPATPLYDVASMADELRAQMALGRMVSAFLGVFGALALLVAAVGLYGVLAYVIRGRRREIAIRQALGATPGEVRAMVLRQGVGLVGVGLAFGMVGALGAGRLAAGLLYGVRAVDPLILGATALALLAVAALASWIPARQATRVQPHTAMNLE